MEIKEAIAYVRRIGSAMREIGQRYATDEKTLAAEVAFHDAEACETVCDKLEAVLAGKEAKTNED